MTQEEKTLLDLIRRKVKRQHEGLCNFQIKEKERYLTAVQIIKFLLKLLDEKNKKKNTTVFDDFITIDTNDDILVKCSDSFNVVCEDAGTRAENLFPDDTIAVYQLVAAFEKISSPSVEKIF